MGERNNCRRGGNIENDPLAVQSTLASTNPSGGSLANPGIVIQLSTTLGGCNADIAEEKAESQAQVGTDDDFGENNCQSP